MDEPLKRDLRREKRQIKKAGVRRVWKQRLDISTDADHDPVLDYGRLSSAPLNGIDRDSTRRRHDESE